MLFPLLRIINRIKYRLAIPEKLAEMFACFLFKEIYTLKIFIFFLNYNVWHLLISRNLGSVTKELNLICWWRCSICYGCTGPYGSDNLDCNKMYVTILSPDVALLFYFCWSRHCFSSPLSSLRCKSCLQSEQMFSNLSMSITLMFLLQTSLNQSCGCPHAGGQFPVQIQSNYNLHTF